MKTTAVKISRTYGYNLEPLKVMRIAEKKPQVTKSFLGIIITCQGREDFKNQNDGGVYGAIRVLLLLCSSHLLPYEPSYVQLHSKPLLIHFLNCMTKATASMQYISYIFTGRYIIELIVSILISLIITYCRSVARYQFVKNSI